MLIRHQTLVSHPEKLVETRVTLFTVVYHRTGCSNSVWILIILKEANWAGFHDQVVPTHPRLLWANYLEIRDFLLWKPTNRSVGNSEQAIKAHWTTKSDSAGPYRPCLNMEGHSCRGSEGEKKIYHQGNRMQPSICAKHSPLAVNWMFEFSEFKCWLPGPGNHSWTGRVLFDVLEERVIWNSRAPWLMILWVPRQDSAHHDGVDFADCPLILLSHLKFNSAETHTGILQKYMPCPDNLDDGDHWRIDPIWSDIFLF